MTMITNTTRCQRYLRQAEIERVFSVKLPADCNVTVSRTRASPEAGEGYREFSRGTEAIIESTNESYSDKSLMKIW